MHPLAFATAAVLLAGALAGRRRPPALRLAALGGAAAAAAYGAGVVDLPSLERIAEQVSATLGPWLYVLIGVMAFLETGALVGLVAPGEITIVLGGVVAGQGGLDVVALVLVVWGAAVLGDLASYALGRRLGRGFVLRYGPRLGATPARVERVERYFHSHGGKTILAGRFVGVVRALAPFLAGASRMRVPRFLAADVAGAGAWAAGLVLAGYLLFESTGEAASFTDRAKTVVVVVTIAAVSAAVAWRLWRTPETRARLAAAARAVGRRD